MGKIPAIVYVAINSVNKKKYIGMTRRTLKQRMSGHKSDSKKDCKYPFYNAIRKYGFENFNFYILAKFDSLEDAYIEEIRLIKLVEPEYNLCSGGRGTSGHIFSEESRKKMSNSADKERFKKYSYLGPVAISKKVMCVTDGKIFPSAASAAKHYGSARSAITELCLGKNFRKTVNKRVFKYLELK